MVTRIRAALALVSAATAACGSQAAQPPPSPTPVAGAVTIRGFEMAFDPSTVVFTHGVQVTVTFSNVGGLDHDLQVAMPVTGLRVVSGAVQVPVDQPPLHVHLRASPGASETVVLTPTSPGTYHVECTLPGHAAAGMVGTFVVV